MPGHLKALAANLLLALLSTALGLGALELVARAALRGQKGGKEQRTRLLYTEHDPLLGWRKRPGARVRYERREYTVDVAINGHGLRDAERGYEAPPGAFRVLALGDSFVEAFMVPAEQMLTRRLEASLSGGRCAVEVLNGGSVGYSTDQEYLFYREEGSRYSPQVVVLFFYYNDVLYNDTPHNIHIPKPLLRFGGPRPQVANYPVPRREAAEPSASPPPPPARGLVALDWLGERLERSQPRLYNALARTGLWKPTRRMEISPELRVYMRSLPPEVKRAWEMTALILRALAQEVQAHAARLLVVYVPSRMEVSDRDWELTCLRYGINDRKWDRARVLGRLQEIASREAIPLLDLTPALRRASGLLSQPYYDYDSHWNARGQELAAREVERRLKQQGWVPDCTGPSAR